MLLMHVIGIGVFYFLQVMVSSGLIAKSMYNGIKTLGGIVMRCLKCGTEHDFRFCPNCGNPAVAEVCPHCGITVGSAKFCPECGTPITSISGEGGAPKQSFREKFAAAAAAAAEDAKNRPMTKKQRIKQRIKENQSNGVACCPKCGSTSLSANKKGFGIGKAVVGVKMIGSLGLVAGNKGAKKVQVTCLNCGHRWVI